MTVCLADGRQLPRRVQALAWALAVALLAALSVYAQSHPSPADMPTTSLDLLADCQEDDPCWDCETMGNLVCGPAVTEENHQP